MHGQYRVVGGGLTPTVVRGGFYGQAGSGPFGATAPIVGSGSYSTSINPIAGQAVGVYRLLWGAGAQVGAVQFQGVPLAYAPGTYNRGESTSQTRVSYGRATTGGFEPWGTWCATCHDDMHSGTGNYVHPVDQSMSTLIPVYNNYVSSGDLSGSFTGDHLYQGPFNSLVPFIKNSSDPAVLKPLAGAGVDTAARLAGASNGDNVSCLSCHRAHASGFPFMLRWQMEGEFITLADTLSAGFQAVWPGTDTTPNSPQFARGRLASENQAAYYDRPAKVLGIYNRVLCNKCHGKD
jgi:predicted CXXCH cytochrome family protein